MPPFHPQKTIRFKTYLKRALVEGLLAVFYEHPDPLLRNTSVGIDFTTDQVEFPHIIVKFYERSINNAGVGHTEWLEDEDHPGSFHLFKHYLYQGDIEFAIYAQTTLDRDYMADTLVEILAMGDLQTYSNLFFKRIYEADIEEDFAVANENFITLNTDKILPFGETQGAAPWGTEDQLVYQTAYRIGVHGEIYNRVDPTKDGTGFVEKVDVYPYRSPLDPEPIPNPNPDDPAQWS